MYFCCVFARTADNHAVIRVTGDRLVVAPTCYQPHDFEQVYLDRISSTAHTFSFQCILLPNTGRHPNSFENVTREVGKFNCVVRIDHRMQALRGRIGELNNDDVLN